MLKKIVLIFLLMVISFKASAENTAFPKDYWQFYFPSEYVVWRYVPDRDIIIIEEKIYPWGVRVMSDQYLIAEKEIQTGQYIVASFDLTIPQEVNINIDFAAKEVTRLGLPWRWGWCTGPYISFIKPCMN